MCTVRVRFQTIIFFLALVGWSGTAWADVYYYMHFSARFPYPAMDFVVRTADFVEEADGWVDLVTPLQVYDATFTRMCFTSNPDDPLWIGPGDTGYILRPDTDPPGALDETVQLEAYYLGEPVTTLGGPFTFGATRVIKRNNDTLPATYTDFGGTGDTFTTTDADPPLVTMTGMWTEQNGRAVVVGWQTASEVGTAGFRVLRSEAGQALQIVTETLIPGKGNASIGGVYQWVDTQVEPGHTYTYMIEEVENSGKANQYGPITAVVLDFSRRSRR